MFTVRISRCYKNEKHVVVNASILASLRVDQSWYLNKHFQSHMEGIRLSVQSFPYL
jgi:hypothetical protein